MAPTDDSRSVDRVASSGTRVSERASALADHNLARRLCQATILLADRELLKGRQVIEMLSSFYPTMIGVSSFSFLSIIIFIILFF